MAFFRTDVSRDVARHRRRSRGAASAADVRLRRMGGAARAQPRFPHAVGADLAGRRPHPRRLPPAAQALCRGPAGGPLLCVLHRAQAGGRAGRRPDARQHPPRRRPGRQHRLLDGRALRAPRPHDRGAAGARPVRFVTLRLHRLEAACIPTNVASIALLEKSGFAREGYARQYLCINGMWQDHLLYARIKDEPPHLLPARRPPISEP